jgi:hypothetical protein
LHFVIGTNDNWTNEQGVTKWKLLVAQNPCACLVCRGKEMVSWPFEYLQRKMWYGSQKTCDHCRRDLQIRTIKWLPAAWSRVASDSWKADWCN